MKRITDKMAVMAQCRWRHNMTNGFPKPSAKDELAAQTGRSVDDCEKALQRAADRGYLDYGVSLRTAWLTDAGLMLIGKEEDA